MQDKSLFGRFLSSIILGGALGYLWGIRGVFVGYSWDIHMYRVCVGKVSKGTGRVGGGMPTTDEHGWTRKKEYRHPCSQARRNNRSTEGR